jgi:hypothetical protein
MSRYRRQRSGERRRPTMLPRLQSSRPVTLTPCRLSIVGLHADDPLAGFHLRRLLNGAKGVRMQLE